MGYLLKSDSTVINAKLTSIGRKLLASGSLTYDKFAFGDSEIDYSENNLDDNIVLSNSMVLAPQDKNYSFKSYITKTDNSSVYNTLPPIVPIEGKVINSALERGFFYNLSANTADIRITSEYVINGGTLNLPTTGDNTITVDSSLSFPTISGFTEPIVGDYAMIYYQNPNLSGVSIDGQLNLTEPTAILWYKIEAKSGSLSGGTITLQLDRPTPNYPGMTSTSKSRVLFFPGGNSIEDFYTDSNIVDTFWSENTLSFNGSCNLSNDDIKVWNMSIVFADSVVGCQSANETYEKYNTFVYKGQRILLSATTSSIGVIHYTNKSFSNYYGESFNKNTASLYLPTIMWHNTTNGKLGLKLTCEATVNVDDNLKTRYYNLVDHIGEVVGRSYNDLKLFVITNTDLLAAMSYISNRNWTYPTPTVEVIESFGGITPEARAFIDPFANDVYVSYLFENEATSFGSRGYAYPTPLPYSQYVKGDIKTVSLNCFLSFKINPAKLPFLRSSSQLSGGTGFTANNFKILVQVTNKGEKPQADLWKVLDITDRLVDYPTWSGTCIPSSSFSTTSPIIFDKDDYDTNSIPFDLNDYINLPFDVGGADKLQFGDEVFLFGNVKTDIEAEVYRSKFVLIANINDFNTSTNVTWESGQPVAISEIGIYTNNDELVAVGKLNYPIEKTKSQLKAFELSIDF